MATVVTPQLAVPEPRAAEPLVETPLARVHGLNHYFGEGDARKQVLVDNSVELRPGEIVIMTGPSGCGKTTLLTLIGALRTVQQGTVEVLGRSLVGLSAAELVEVRRGIGFIFQAHNLFASLTAYQNVCMALQLTDRSPAARHDRAVEVLTQLGLEHRLHYRPQALSGGQRQRVAIARALAARPQLILADEPTAALGRDDTEKVVHLLEDLARQQRTAILLVTHDDRYLDVADRIISMRDGRIASDKPVELMLKICTFLKKCPVFAGLSPDALTKVAEKMKSERFPPGAVIVRQGEPGYQFYLIRSGIVDVFKEDGPERQLLNTLKDSDYFGEIALLETGVRTATVVARTAVEVWTLDKPDFDAALQRSDSFKEQIYKVLFMRH